MSIDMIDYDMILNKAIMLVTHTILIAYKTIDLGYYARLDSASLKVYEALNYGDKQDLVDATNELERLISEEEKYGALDNRTKKT